MSDKANVHEVALGSARPSFMTKLKAHFRRWWWVHLIIFCSVVLIIALPVVYVGYPNIAQDDINDSSLDVQSMQISDPTPEGFHLNQTQIIRSGSVFKPKIFAFDADVSLLGSPTFGTVTIPQTQGRDGFVVNVNQDLELTDVDAFAAFSTAVMLNEEFQLNIYGEPRLKLGALPTIDIDYNKTITMKGLNGLAGFAIESLNLQTESTNGRNANGTVFIPNPSVLQLAMGNLTLDISVNGTAIGQTFLDDLVLHPGDNRVPMFSNLDMTAMLAYIGGLSDVTRIPLTITGNENSSTYNGNVIPYFSAALAANTLTVELDVAEVIG